MIGLILTTGDENIGDVTGLFIAKEIGLPIQDVGLILSFRYGRRRVMTYDFGRQQCMSQPLLQLGLFFRREIDDGGWRLHWHRTVTPASFYLPIKSTKGHAARP